MPAEKRIEYLLLKCLQQRETKSDREELNGYLLDPQLKELVEACLMTVFEAPKEMEELSEDTKEQILTAIYSTSDTKSSKSNNIRLIWWAAAAAVCVFLALPLKINKELRHSILQLNTITQEQIKPVEKIAGKKEILPAINAATLEMLDGTKLYLPKIIVGTEIVKNGLIIRKTSDSELHLEYDINVKSNALSQYHVIRTQKGGKYNLILPDGTRVYMNSNSKITLPSSFTDSTRSVELEGEAYFDVVKDEKMFTVYSKRGKNKQMVNVYGTAFNISAYQDDNFFETTLVRGSVNIQNIDNGEILWLKPQERVVLSDLGFVKSKADVDRNLAWMNNLFYFEDESLDNVIKQISRWYDVDFRNVPKNSNQKFWAQFSRDVKLQDLLLLIEKTNDIKFEIVGKEVYIMN